MAPLAVSIGDPAGIGPEIIVESWARRSEAGLAPFFVVGGASVLAEAARRRGLAVEIEVISDPAKTALVFDRAIPVLGTEDVAATPGKPDEPGAALALHSLAEATRYCLLGASAGLVTAPIGKAQLAKVGFEYPGQTEFLAEVCGLAPDEAVMMLAGPSLRAVPLTVHCALADVPGVTLMPRETNHKHNFQYIVTEVDPTKAGLTRDELISALRLENVYARRYFYPGCHRMQPYAGLNPRAGYTLPVTEAVAGAEGLPDTAEPWVADYAAGHADDLEQVTVALDEAGERRCLGRDDDLLLGRLGVGDAIEVLCDDLTPQMYGEDVVSIVVRDRRTWCEGEEELTVEWYSVVEPMRDSLTAYLEAHPELCAGDLS